jgi:hypothetical protein
MSRNVLLCTLDLATIGNNLGCEFLDFPARRGDAHEGLTGSICFFRGLRFKMPGVKYRNITSACSVAQTM